MKTGVVLFAHGSRDPRWAEPFGRLAERVATTEGAPPVKLAYLDFMTPDLVAAAESLVGQGCSALRIVPVFLGQGGHLREDLPRRVEAVRARFPQVTVELLPAVGEHPDVLAAIAAVALAGL
ncbi:MAG: CbiX/SirB N-terminal domain-containing protein [Burkholderiales bacterium]